MVMFHIIYKITNNINGRYYIGRHSTRNIDDGYMGSGKAIINAIRKYGIEHFSKTIIAQAESTEKLWELEKQIVNEEVVADPLSYNMAYGGKGYLDGLKRHNKKSFFEHQSRAGRIGGLSNYYQHKTDSQRRNWHSKGGKVAAKVNRNNNHPFYTGQASAAGGRAIKGMRELWNPESTATNKNQKEYQRGHSQKARVGSDKYTNLIKQGWLPIEEHKQRIHTKAW